MPFTPPAVYRTWWTQIEACAGLWGDFDRVEWYEVPGSSYSCPTYEGGYDGRGGERSEHVGHRAEHVGDAIESKQQLQAGEREPRGGERRHQTHDARRRN